jgi:hypothetical protein
MKYHYVHLHMTKPYFSDKTDGAFKNREDATQKCHMSRIIRLFEGDINRK